MKDTIQWWGSMLSQPDLETSVVYTSARSQYIHRQATVKAFHEFVFTLHCSSNMVWTLL